MIRSLTYGSSGMNAFQTKIDVIANNIANINTTAYKRSSAGINFTEQVQMLTAGPASSYFWNTRNGTEQILGNGVKVVLIAERDIKNGASIPTGRNLDLAIDGTGYFAVELPDGETGYTRDGSFSIDKEGFLSTKEGYRLRPGIQVKGNAEKIVIDSNGDVWQPGEANGGKGEKLGEIRIYKFQNTSALTARGENIYTVTKSSGDAGEGRPGNEDFGTLKQGHLELSNVDPVIEMTELMEAQRAYQVNARSVRTSDEMWGMAINLRK